MLRRHTNWVHLFQNYIFYKCIHFWELPVEKIHLRGIYFGKIHMETYASEKHLLEIYTQSIISVLRERQYERL